MRHTINLTEGSELALRAIAEQGGVSIETALETIAETVLTGRPEDAFARYEDGVLHIEATTQIHPIRSTPGVMGGDACIRNTRIPVWQLIQFKQSGSTEERILANFPGLTAADLASAWDYYAANSSRVEAERLAHEDAA